MRRRKLTGVAVIRRPAAGYRPHVEQLEDRLPPGQLWSLLGSPELSLNRPTTTSSANTVANAPASSLGLGEWSAQNAHDLGEEILSNEWASTHRANPLGLATIQDDSEQDQTSRLLTPASSEIIARGSYAAGDVSGAAVGVSAWGTGVSANVPPLNPISTLNQAAIEAMAALRTPVDRIELPGARGLIVSMVADTNRDGIVNVQDEDGKDTWTPTRGAIYTVNFDDDNANGQPDAVTWNDQGRPTSENKVVDNAADVADLAPLVIQALGAGYNPNTMRVYLRAGSVEDAQSIHVFPSLTAGATAILGDLGTRAGGAAAPTRIDITSRVSATTDTVFGVEGMNFRYVGAGVPAYQQFDGYIDLTLEVEQNSTIIGSSRVRMKVAPWVMSTHAESSREAWAVNLGSTNAPFLYTANADPGYYGLDSTGHLRIASGSERWVQDHGEVGWTQRPGGPLTQMSFRLPYYRGTGVQPTWMQQSLLWPDWGTFQLGNLIGNQQDYKGDYGGNLEAIPPMPGYPLGRIVQGNLRSDLLAAFMTSQEVQTPNASPPTRWLRVGHIDEMITFLPNHRVMIADTREAYRLMEALSPAERGAVFFATGRTPVSAAASANSTSATRLLTGMNLTGQSWRYLRLYSGNGAGQVARIATNGLGNGYIDIDAVWDTGTQVRAYSTGQRTNFARLPQAGDQFTLVEGVRSWSGTTPAIVTVHEVLNDAAFRTLNTQYVQGQLDQAQAILRQNDAPVDVLQFVSVPVLYLGTAGPNFATARSAVAFTPGAENSYPLGVDGSGSQTVYVPRQYGPRNAQGVDIFEAAVRRVAPTARFVNDWDSYHVFDGELHCGVLAPRNAPGNWWAV